MKPFKLSVCQMMVGDNKEDNLNKAEAMIRKAVKEEGANVVVLPEIFNGPYNIDLMSENAEPEDGPSSQRLASLAKELQVVIVGGSISELAEEGIHNTSYTFDETGKCIGRHRKMHLFDVDIPGGISFLESAIVAPGNDVTVFNTTYGRFGIAICYDMRFPELMRLMVQEGAEIIIVPAAFNTTTGPAHWHETIKVRAVDNQVYFVAAAPARNREATYHAYGHSKILDPWGTVLAEIDEKEGIISAAISPRRQEEVRQQLPLLKHRRHDIYKLEKRQWAEG